MNTDHWVNTGGNVVKSCPDCGWLMACPKCSDRFDKVDEDIDRRAEVKKEMIKDVKG